MFSPSRLISICFLLAVLSTATPTASVSRLTSSLHPFNHPGLNPSGSAKQVTSPDQPSLDNTARDILSRATPVPPHFLVYGDRSTPGVTGPPTTSQIQGFNVYALAFLLTSGPFDKAAEWTQLSSTQRASIKAQYASAGIKLIVSAFGSTDAPTSNRADPIATANTMASFVVNFDLDGIDVDYEDFNAFNIGTGAAENWLISFTTQLRAQLPQGSLLTHAPVAPWFSPNIWGGGGYLHIHNSVGNLIDWYNVQFYNQGTREYITCRGLLTSSSRTWPQSAVFEIAANGVDLNKIVIGKPATNQDASNGFMTTSTLSGCLLQAKQMGWSAGAMVWEFPDADATWIRAVRSQAFPE